VVQGIGGALFEHCLYDERGQLLNGNMADLSRADGGRDARHRGRHVVTPPPIPNWAPKGAARPAPPARPGAVNDAINDALRPLGDEPLTDMPFSRANSTSTRSHLAFLRDEDGGRATIGPPLGANGTEGGPAVGAISSRMIVK